jgi:dolichyl-diphosphooligosaccharide--protein glycosyltransferase
MVAAWGGFIFVINMIALHAAVLILVDWAQGRYSVQLYKSYTAFYIVGTLIATRVPPVGLMPFKSLEQLSGLIVFVGLQVLQVSEIKRTKLNKPIWSLGGVKIRLTYIFGFVASGILIAIVLAPTGFFGPLSSRVRSLFVEHMKTGNPLVDSVAEHQPADKEAFQMYLHVCAFIAPYGIPLILFLHNFRQSSFLVLNAFVVYFFALKMARLLILTAVPASALSGVVIGGSLDYVLSDFWWSPKTTSTTTQRRRSLLLQQVWKSIPLRAIRISILAFALWRYQSYVPQFLEHAVSSAQQHSDPQIMFKHQTEGGQIVIIDDYREAYWWLRDKTPKDSRVLAWWDYGYQITGIGNRTTIADGNTWNHEHIATLGRCLTSPVRVAHRMIRHLADYVLIWAGGDGDDIQKSPWMARIGNSVYSDICPNDPLCDRFGFDEHGGPTPMMKKSLLFNLHSAGHVEGVGPDPKYFTEAFTSQHGLVRIFKVMNISQESKKMGCRPCKSYLRCTGKLVLHRSVSSRGGTSKSASQTHRFQPDRGLQSQKT